MVTPTFQSRQEQALQFEHGAPVEELLRRLYVDEGLTQAQVAERLGVHVRSVIRWMAKYGIQTRDRRALAATA